jgi:N-acetylmuramoyl-L-alanine amidase
MNEVLAYAFKSVLCSALFCAYYWLLLRNRRLHAFNRCYILAAVSLSLVLPLLQLSLPGLPLPQETKVYRLPDVAPGAAGEEITVTGTTAAFGWQAVCGVVYAAGVLLMALLLGAKLACLYRLLRKGTRSAQQGYTLVHTDDARAPFSFLHVLFWKDSLDRQSAEGSRILAHELVHIRQRHSLDKLYLQSVLVFCWFNPFLWLLQKEQSLVHEFIADEGAIENRDTALFARMLLQEYCGNSYPDITLPFYSSTKRRLLMLDQSNKPRFALTRRLMALPLLGTALLLFSFRPGDTPVVRAKQNLRLALDAGHGGADDGAAGINDVKEKDLALKITRRLAQMAGAYNVSIVPLRPEDQDVSLPDRTAKANAAAADVLVSVHLNAAEEANQRPGFEIVLTNHNSRPAESRELASAVATQLQALRISTRLSDKRLALLRTAAMPAILIECGDIGQAKDVQRINDPAQLDRLCAAILDGVVAYRNNRQ